MGSLVGCSPPLLHNLALQKQGVFFNPGKHRNRRRVLASRSDEASAAGQIQGKQNEKPSSSSFLNRRATLALLAFSASPFVVFGSGAFGGVLADKNVMDVPETFKSQKSEFADAGASPTQQQNATSEFTEENKSQGSALFGLLNEIGIIGSGIVGALYMTERKGRVAAESIIEANATDLKEKEIAMASLREDLEGRIQLEQDKNQKREKKAQEEQVALSKELISAKGMATGLQKQLEIERNMVQEMEAQVEIFKSEISLVQEDNETLKRDLEVNKKRLNELEEKVNLANITIQEKEKEVGNLRFSLKEREKNIIEISFKAEQTRKLFLQAEAQIKELRLELDNAKNELCQKDLSLKELDKKLILAVVEKEDSKEKLAMLHKELNQMKLTFDKDLVSSRQAIFAKQEEVNQLKEKLRIAYDETKRNKEIAARFQEKNSTLEALLEEKNIDLKNVNGELQRSIESLEVSRSQVAILSSDLATSQQVKMNLESEITMLQNDRDAIRSSLEEKVHEEEETSRTLSSELGSVKKALDISRNEILFLSKKLKDSAASNENIKEELSKICKTAETSFAALNEQKQMSAALSSKLEASERNLLEEKENNRMLQRDFEEATKSMEEMRNCIMSLSEELEISKSKINNLEEERDSLYESLEKQNQLTKEVQEGAEHANKLLMRLEKEKDAYLKRAKKLEEEISSAKGEILRLRKQIIWTNAPSREAQQQKKKGKQSHGNERQRTDVSLQIEGMQAELSQIQKKLGVADHDQVIAAGTSSLLNEGVNLEEPSQDIVTVAPVSTHDTC